MPHVPGIRDSYFYTTHKLRICDILGVSNTGTVPYAPLANLKIEHIP